MSKINPFNVRNIPAIPKERQTTNIDAVLFEMACERNKPVPAAKPIR